MRLKDKVVLVAAAGGGMGTAVPLLFAQEGAKVVVSARREGPLQEIVGKIQKNGGEASFVSADLVTEAGAQKAVEYTERTYGRMDILFSNLGDSAGRGLRLHETDEPTWDFLTDINIKGHYQCSRQAVPALMRAGGGVIILMTASHDVRLRAHSGYSAGKAGTIALVQTMARAYRKDNIRVVGIASSGGVQNVPEGPIDLPPPNITRTARSEDIAYAALFLASQEATWITGSVVTLDGGNEVALDAP